MSVCPSLQHSLSATALMPCSILQRILFRVSPTVTLEDSLPYEATLLRLLRDSIMSKANVIKSK